MSSIPVRRYKAILDRRLAVMMPALGIGFVLLIIRLLALQISREGENSLRAQRNNIRQVPVPAARGLIRDRNGRMLARNVPRLDLWYFPFPGHSWPLSRNGAQQVLDGIRGGKGLTLPTALRSNSSPSPLIQGIPESAALALGERRSEIPGFEVVVSGQRLYPEGEVCAPALGYLGMPSPRDLADPSLSGTSRIQRLGKAGVERSFEKYLRGRNGIFRVVVDGLGRQVRSAGSDPPRRGWDLDLALDERLQVTAWDLLQGMKGAVVALDPRNGDVLAMVSAPSFDPGSLSRGIPGAAWRKLVEDPSAPMQNRVVGGLYPPGSLFKIVTATAGLETGVIQPDTTSFCSGGWAHFGTYLWFFKCWSQHGTVNLDQALAQSCNVYFYRAGKAARVPALNRYALMYGFGEKTGVDLPEEREGLIPNPSWRHRVRGTSWVPGNTIQMAIGQGDVLATPLQLACAYASLAMGGRSYVPRLVLSARNEATGEVKDFAPRLRPGNLDLAPSTFEALQTGFRHVVEGARGTGRSARIPGLAVAGKTGTAEVPKGDDHAMFVGYAPADHPQFLAAVLVENGGGGGRTAGPIARYLIEQYFGLPHKQTVEQIRAARNGDLEPGA